MITYGDGMKDFKWFVVFTLVGFGGGVSLAVTTDTYITGSLVEDLIHECETTLPRNVKCIIKANAEIPEKGDYNWPPNKFR